MRACACRVPHIVQELNILGNTLSICHYFIGHFYTRMLTTMYTTLLVKGIKGCILKYYSVAYFKNSPFTVGIFFNGFYYWTTDKLQRFWLCLERVMDLLYNFEIVTKITLGTSQVADIMALPIAINNILVQLISALLCTNCNPRIPILGI